MNIRQLHNQDKPVSTISIFKGAEGNATAIQILKGQQLKEHLTKVPALLICIEGEVVFENEKGIKETLLSGDYVHIEPLVKHWLDAKTEGHLILLK